MHGAEVKLPRAEIDGSEIYFELFAKTFEREEPAPNAIAISATLIVSVPNGPMPTLSRSITRPSLHVGWTEARRADTHSSSFRLQS